MVNKIIIYHLVVTYFFGPPCIVLFIIISDCHEDKRL